MEKLRNTLEQYGRWKPLAVYVDRMEASLESDFSNAVENAKALLESIGKEICQVKAVELPAAASINAVMKRSFMALGYTSEDLVSQVSGALANIGQQVGNLCNEISPTSHGKPLAALSERNDKVDLLTREFLIDSTLVVAVFLIRSFEERHSDIAPPRDAEANITPDYEDNAAFNNYWDETFGEFAMGQYSYPASEILFNVDAQAYAAEHKAFMEADEEPAGDEL